MYVPDDSVLGNPGVFGFISKAVKGVAKVVGGALGIQGVPKISIPAPVITIVPTQAAAQAAAQGAVTTALQRIPPWVLPAAAIGLAAILILPRLTGGRR